jgi:hypothetical protein
VVQTQVIVLIALGRLQQCTAMNDKNCELKTPAPRGVEVFARLFHSLARHVIKPGFTLSKSTLRKSFDGTPEITMMESCVFKAQDCPTNW